MIRQKRRNWAKKHVRVCRGCSKQFAVETGEINRGSGKFCSHQCWYQWRRSQPMPSRTCVKCGKTFTNRECPNKKYCSVKCFHLARQFVHSCSFCGREVRRKLSSLGVKYCSLRCRNKGMAKCKEQHCVGCGAAFKPITVTRPRKYCSRPCRDKHQRGPNSPLFRGERRHYRGTDWYEQRDAARMRDGACVKCSAPPRVGQKLSVDHIVPFRLARQYAEAMPLGPSPNHLTNLASLCRRCHAYKLHPEARLLRGDVIGFIAEVKAVIPLERIEAALALYGLSVPKTSAVGS